MSHDTENVLIRIRPELKIVRLQCRLVFANYLMMIHYI